jgi:histidyl-tRNA synthetase
MGEALSTKPVKGTRDFFPEEMALRQWLFNQWREVAARFGFQEYDTCVLEHEELYIRKAGDEITSQLYNFEDKGGRRVSLRPEMTPSLARMVMAGQRAQPLRWFAIPQCFRYERAQKGRKREHFQWNMDIIGVQSVAAEVELMSSQLAFLEGIGLHGGSDVQIRVSDRRILQEFLAQNDVTDERFAATCVIVDKLAKIGPEKTEELLKTEVGLAAELANKLIEILAADTLEAVEVLVGTDNAGVISLRSLLNLSEAAGIKASITIDLSIVRGLSYYTGTVWELFDIAGTMRAIAGGGRYDNLISSLGGAATPMVGFGFGDVVILDLLEEKGLLPPMTQDSTEVVYPMSEEELPQAMQVAAARRAQGHNVALDATFRRFKHIVSKAEKDGAVGLWIIGSQEREQNVVKYRSLANRAESEVALAAVADWAAPEQ